MDNILELISIVTKNKLKGVVDWGLIKRSDTDVARLYDILATGKAQDDESAMAALFGEQPNKVKYSRIKKSLEEYLLKMILVIDLNQPHYHARQQAYFECYKKWAVLRVLTGKYARQSALSLAEELLLQAQKYDFTEITIDVLRMLRLFYGSLIGDRKQYLYYKEQAAFFEGMYAAENLAEELYTELAFQFTNSKSVKKEIQQVAQESYAQLAESLEKYDSYRLHFSGRLIQLMIHTSVNDYQAALVVCRDAIQFFDAKNYVANVPLQAFLYQEMVCYVQLKDYEAGRKAAERGLQLLENGSFNWFKYQELLTMLSLHSREYQAALGHYNTAVAHKNFKSLPKHIEEYWKILGAYLFFLSETGRLQLYESEYLTKFKVARFFNDVPTYSRDKRGMNIAILVFQILMDIQNKQYNKLIDKIEAIEKYASRYLKSDDDTYRSNCFIKMLLQIPSSHFHQTAVIRNTEKYFKMLTSVSLSFANQSHDIEIIPYEDLWEIVVSQLERGIVRS
ncbi:MAG: hypothetical protein ACK4NS_08205 [Saprospiraceae bacterium]